MQKAWSVWLFVVLFTVIGSAAKPDVQDSRSASGEPFVGTWAGKWEGDGGSGAFELTLEKGKESPVGGRVSVTDPT